MRRTPRRDALARSVASARFLHGRARHAARDARGSPRCPGAPRRRDPSRRARDYPRPGAPPARAASRLGGALDGPAVRPVDRSHARGLRARRHDVPHDRFVWRDSVVDAAPLDAVDWSWVRSGRRRPRLAGRLHRPRLDWVANRVIASQAPQYFESMHQRRADDGSRHT